MSGWREKALDLLPELREEIEEDEHAFALENPYALWIEISPKFEEAYKSPTNDDLIRRVYELARWSLETDNEEGEATAAIVTFYEYLPILPAARKDMPRWFTRNEFQELKEAFRYFLTDEEHHQFVEEFFRGKSVR